MLYRYSFLKYLKLCCFTHIMPIDKRYKCKLLARWCSPRFKTKRSRFKSKWGETHLFSITNLYRIVSNNFEMYRIEQYKSIDKDIISQS